MPVMTTRRLEPRPEGPDGKSHKWVQAYDSKRWDCVRCGWYVWTTDYKCPDADGRYLWTDNSIWRSNSRIERIPMSCEEIENNPKKADELANLMEYFWKAAYTHLTEDDIVRIYREVVVSLIVRE